MRDAATVLLAELGEPSDNSYIALFPLTPDTEKLARVCQVLTRLLASRLEAVQLFKLAEQESPSPDGLMTPKAVKMYGERLQSRWIITGHVAELDTRINVNLFLWDTRTGNLLYMVDRQLSLSAALVSLYETSSRPDFQPYGVQWRSLPIFALTVAVADVNGDGFNELIVADEKQVSALTWTGWDFQRSAEMPSVQYAPTDTPVSDRTWRRMFAADNDENDRDELYISAPPNRTWQVQWGDAVIEHQPMFLAQAGARLVVGEAVDGLIYQGSTTACWVWREKRIGFKHPCALPVDYHTVAVGQANPSSTADTVVTVDTTGHLRVYEVESSRVHQIWQSPPIFGKGLAIGDLNGDGVPEIVGTAKDLPATPTVSDQFIILERTGAIYGESWRSPLLDGEIVDMQTGDVDNDHRNELVISLRTQRGGQIVVYEATQ